MEQGKRNMVIGGMLIAAIMIVGMFSPFVSTGEGAARRFGAESGSRIAEIFHTDKDTFMQDVKSGKSLEEIAILHGVDPKQAEQVLTDRLNNALRIASTMANRRAGGFLGNRRGNAGTVEKLTAEEMRVLQDNLPVYVDKAFTKPGLLNATEKVKNILGAGAKALGMSQNEMMQQLQSGTKVQALAESRGVPLSEVTAEMSREINRQADELVAERILPDFLAKRLKTNLDTRINKMLQLGYSKDWMDSNQELWTTVLH